MRYLRSSATALLAAFAGIGCSDTSATATDPGMEAPAAATAAVHQGQGGITQEITDAACARMAVVQDPDITRASVEAGIGLALSRSAIPGVAVTIAFDKTPSPGGNWRNRGTMQSVYVGVQHRFGFFGPLFKALTGSETITIASHAQRIAEPTVRHSGVRRRSSTSPSRRNSSP